MNLALRTQRWSCLILPLRNWQSSGGELQWLQWAAERRDPDQGPLVSAWLRAALWLALRGCLWNCIEWNGWNGTQMEERGQEDRQREDRRTSREAVAAANLSSSGLYIGLWAGAGRQPRSSFGFTSCRINCWSPSGSSRMALFAQKTFWSNEMCTTDLFLRGRIRFHILCVSHRAY